MLTMLACQSKSLGGGKLDFIDAYSADNLKFLLKGFYVTLQVAFISMILSFFIGCIIGTLRYTKIRIVAPLLMLIVETLRNLPLLLIIFFTYFALPEVGIKLNVFMAAINTFNLIPTSGSAKYVKKIMSNNGKFRSVSTISISNGATMRIFV